MGYRKNIISIIIIIMLIFTLSACSEEENEEINQNEDIIENQEMNEDPTESEEVELEEDNDEAPTEANDEIIEEEAEEPEPEEIESEEPEPELEESDTQEGLVKIIELNKKAEYVTIENTGTAPTDISGWRVVSVKGEQSFVFPSGYTLEPGQQCKLTSGDLKGTGDFTMANTTIWNNSSKDPAELYDNSGELIDRYED